MTFVKGRSGNPRGRPPKAGQETGQGKAAGPEDLAGLSTEGKAQAVEATLWRWLRDAKADRDRGSLARELTAAIRLIGELKRELRAGGDTNVLIVTQQRDELRGELAEREKSWDAEMSAVVGALAGFPEARRSVLGALARVRAIAEHGDRPGYPIMALPAPEAAEEEAVQPPPGLAPQAAAGTDVPLPTEKGVPAAAAPAEPASPPLVDGQGRPLPPGWTVGPLRRRPRFGGYGDEFPG